MTEKLANLFFVLPVLEGGDPFLERGNHSLEALHEAGELDFLLPGSVEDEFLGPFRKLLERNVDVELEVLRERLENSLEPGLRLIRPGRHRAVAQRKRRV